MKANELRIGNYFMDRGGKVLRLDFWDSPGKLAMNNVIEGTVWHPLTEDVKYAKPVPLTEEWLLRFGFVNDKLEYFTIEYDNHAGYGLFYRGNLLTGIEYVHQLQNLYFALTGTELEIK